MTGSIYTILTCLFAIAGLSMLFVPRMPAVVASFLAMLCAYFGGSVFVNEKVLIYWSVAAAIVLVLRNLQGNAALAERRGNAYVAVGAIAGAFLGFATAPTSAAVIIGSALGAFLGSVAYTRLPGCPKISPFSGRFVQFLCGKGLQAVVTVAMSAIAAASVL